MRFNPKIDRIKRKVLYHLKEDPFIVKYGFLAWLIGLPTSLAFLWKFINWWVAAIVVTLLNAVAILFLMWRYDMFDEIEMLINMMKMLKKNKKENEKNVRN